MNLRLFNVVQIAEILGVNPRTVKRYIEAGRLLPVNVGPRLIRISETELNRFLGQKDTQDASSVSVKGRKNVNQLLKKHGI